MEGKPTHPIADPDRLFPGVIRATPCAGSGERKKGNVMVREIMVWLAGACLRRVSEWYE